jgi:tRNA threonylcarbamoyladenosine biosynthesis protein TsaB
MSLILNIDSSLQHASVSLSQNGKILEEIHNDNQKEHAAFIHVATQKLLANKQFSSLDAIAVTIGPGSYTGLRVGLAAAKGMCYALNKPLITIGTLDAMAKTASLELDKNTDIILCPMIDARRMEVFTAIYHKDLQVIMQPAAIILDNTSFLNELQENKILFFGDGMQKWKNIHFHENISYHELGYITHAINLLSFQKFEKQQFTELSLSVPLYVKEFYNK